MEISQYTVTNVVMMECLSTCLKYKITNDPCFVQTLLEDSGICENARELSYAQCKEKIAYTLVPPVFWWDFGYEDSKLCRF